MTEIEMQESTKLIFTAQIGEGTVWLDKMYSREWPKNVNLDRLSMIDSCNCIVGQLDDRDFNCIFETYEDCLHAANLGFYVDNPDYVNMYARQTEEWKEKIRQLRISRNLQ